MKIRRHWRLLAAALLWPALAVGVAAAGPDTARATRALRDLHTEHAAFASQKALTPFTSRNPLARVVDDRVVIDAVANGDVGALEASLRALGMQNISVYGRVISGQLPLSAVPALEGVAHLRFARPSAARRKSVTSQGDVAVRANVARSAFGVTGVGVQVGVLSDSFDCRHGAAANVAAGELSPVTVVEEISGCSDGTDEGRAILQIVHDVAPGASLSFASAFNGEASFANNILALKANGAKVILDDIDYFDEPMLQDGIISQAIDTVVAQGAAYFTAGGNDARRSYESPFRPGATFADGAISAPSSLHFFGGIAHNFAPSGPADHMQRITIGSGRTLIITFQWDSPFFSVSGTASPNDLDIYLLNAAGTQVVARSVENNSDPNTGGDAVEILTFTNSGPTADFNLMILKFSGPSPGFMKYIQLGGSGITIKEFDTASGTVFGHANAAGAATVGAAFYAETPAFGISPPLLEPYSSSGPTPILFDTAGNRLPSPVLRAKPEIVAPDGVSTTGVDATLFEPFFGTSAAAPHAAAVAALLLQQRPGLSPGAVYGALETTALDMGPPGFDFDSGFGLIQADAALEAVSLPGITLGLTLNRHTIVAGDPLQVSFSLTNSGTSALINVYFLLVGPPAFSTAVGCPAGDAVLFLASGFTNASFKCLGAAPPQTFPPLFGSLAVPAAGAPLAIPHSVGFGWPGGLPPGTYTWIVLTTSPGAFADGVINPGDISAFAIDSLTAN